MTTNRRQMLRNAAALGLGGTLTDWNAWLRLGPTRAAEESRTARNLVELEPDVEPLVRKIEETPREKCFDMITVELAGGLTYRRFLAALFLAGVRNVNPQPPGFDLHCVFVIHAAHQMSLDALPGERLLPLYWALDEFKKAQASDAKKNGDWRMVQLRGRLPSAAAATQEFHEAMEAWDIPRAERAVVMLVRTRSAGEVMETMWRYGARDFRNIGHKAIFVANAWRTLQTIGWRHAEPVLRSLVTGLLDFGRDQRVNEYVYADQVNTWQQSIVATGHLPADWAAGTADDGVMLRYLQQLREGATDGVCQAAVTELDRGSVNATALWDAAHLAAGEQMMRQPGIVGLHAVTSVNALHYAFQATTVEATRLNMLLQALGWVCQFHHAELARKEPRFDVDLVELESAELPSNPNEAVAAVFEAKSKPEAARLALAYGRKKLDADAFATAARSLVFSKGNEPHGYKYPVAVFEDYRLVSPQWRPQMLATAVYHLPNSQTADVPLMQNARELVRSLT
jgi:hypothetical protein